MEVVAGEGDRRGVEKQGAEGGWRSLGGRGRNLEQRCSGSKVVSKERNPASGFDLRWKLTLYLWMDALRGGDGRYLQPTHPGRQAPAMLRLHRVLCASVQSQSIPNLSQIRSRPEDFCLAFGPSMPLGSSPRACSGRSFLFAVEVSSVRQCLLLAAASGRPASRSRPASACGRSSAAMDRSARSVVRDGETGRAAEGQIYGASI